MGRERERERERALGVRVPLSLSFPLNSHAFSVIYSLFSPISENNVTGYVRQLRDMLVAEHVSTCRLRHISVFYGTCQSVTGHVSQ